MLPSPARKYLLAGLTGTPDVLEGLLNRIPPGDPAWDVRPDPERFTLREIVAHLADWEPIFLDRMVRVRDQVEPHLEDIDEGQMAIAHDYAHSDPHAQIARFRAGRAAQVSCLRSLPESAWERIGHRETIGPITLEGLAVLALGHDGYHTQQIAQWLVAIPHGSIGRGVETDAA